jgi:hypothetical protein
MTTIDMLSLETVIGGAGAASTKSPAQPAKPTTPDFTPLAGDAVTGCLDGLKAGKVNFGACASGALKGVLSGLGSIFSSSKTSK